MIMDCFGDSSSSWVDGLYSSSYSDAIRLITFGSNPTTDMRVFPHFGLIVSLLLKVFPSSKDFLV